MELKEFKALYKKISAGTLPKEVLSSKEREKFYAALFEDRICADWYLKEGIKNSGVDYKKYCCLDMAYHLIEDVRSKKMKGINYNCVMTHSKRTKDFGIPIHDGGSSFIKINFCPWCGKKL